MEAADQQDLPLESYLESLREDVKTLGGSTKVGAWFIPEKSQEAQRNYVNDRLSSARRERFTDDQVELIMRRAIQARGHSDALNYLCDRLGMERPKPKDPELERRRAMERFAEAADRMSAAVDDIKRLNISMPLRKVV